MWSNRFQLLLYRAASILTSVQYSCTVTLNIMTWLARPESLYLDWLVPGDLAMAFVSENVRILELNVDQVVSGLNW